MNTYVYIYVYIYVTALRIMSAVCADTRLITYMCMYIYIFISLCADASLLLNLL